MTWLEEKIKKKFLNHDLMHPIFLLYDQVPARQFPALRDYEGGSDPILIYLFVCFLSISFIAASWWGLSKAMRIMRFHRICSAAKISREEIGCLKSHFRRMHIHDPLDIAMRRKAFDQLMNHIAHYYESLNIEEATLPKELQPFVCIREKLGFIHTPQESHLESTRSLPLGLPLGVIMSDGGTGQLITFHTKVVSNNDFFLGIAPPEIDLGKRFYERPIELAITFQRGKQREYSFQSRFIRLLHSPNKQIYIQHSQEFHKASIQKAPEKPAELMVTVDEDSSRADLVQQYPAFVSRLTNKSCCLDIQVAKKQPVPKASMHGLINMEVSGKPRTFRGMIVEIQAGKSGEFFCKFNFIDLEKEDEQILIQQMLEQRKKKKRTRN